MCALQVLEGADAWRFKRINRKAKLEEPAGKPNPDSAVVSPLNEPGMCTAVAVSCSGSSGVEPKRDTETETEALRTSAKPKKRVSFADTAGKELFEERLLSGEFDDSEVQALIEEAERDPMRCK